MSEEAYPQGAYQPQISSLKLIFSMVLARALRSLRTVRVLAFQGFMYTEQSGNLIYGPGAAL
jgi:hypothetical protein